MQSLIPQNMRHNNPYENIYRSMHLQVNPHITRAHAEEIARQLGYIHNTFGIVASDLIKILSFRFPQENTHPQQNAYQQEGNKWNRSTEQQRVRDSHYGEKMDEQNIGNKVYEDRDPRVGITSIKKPKDLVTVQIGMEQGQNQVGNQKIANSMIQPPNFDFLGEFVYDKSTHEQTKINLLAAKNNLLKDHMSKIIQKVSNKKKETKSHDMESSSPKSQAVVRMNQNQHMHIENNHSRDQVEMTKVQERVLISLHQNNQSQFDKPITNNQQIETAQNNQLSFLQQFEYSNIEKPREEQKQKPPIKQNMHIQTKNKLWQLMRQKEAPEILQISDDD